MAKKCFPDLLGQKATLLGSLTRYDLLAVGIGQLLCSTMKAPGTYSLFFSIFLVLILRFCRKRLKRGFFRHCMDGRCMEWSYAIGDREP